MYCKKKQTKKNTKKKGGDVTQFRKFIKFPKKFECQNVFKGKKTVNNLQNSFVISLKVKSFRVRNIKKKKFSSWVRQRAIFIWGLSILLFLLIKKVDFFVSEGLLCLYEKRVQLEEKFHIYARPSIILYVFIDIDSIIAIYITHKLAFTLWKLTFP